MKFTIVMQNGTTKSFSFENDKEALIYFGDIFTSIEYNGPVVRFQSFQEYLNKVDYIRVSVGDSDDEIPF